MEASPQRILAWLAGLFAGFTLLVTLVFFGWWAFKDYFVFGDAAFEQVGWMVPAKSYAECARGDMVHDLRRRHLPPGMSKTEVMQLLGRPDHDDGSQIEYELGVCAWVVHGLRLYFSREDRLMHTAIVKH